MDATFLPGLRTLVRPVRAEHLLAAISRSASRLPAAARAETPARGALAAFGILVAALAVLSTVAAEFETLPGDLELARAIQGIDSQALRGAMRLATDMTSPTYSMLGLLVVVTVLAALGRPRLALFSAGGLAAHALGGAIKFIVNRSRPDPDLVRTVRLEEEFSYPSGHVEWVAGFEGFCLFAVFQLTSNLPIRALATLLWLSHLALTSAGRIDQGLHWPSDILGSYLVGAIALATLIWLYRVSLRAFPTVSAPTKAADAAPHPA